MKNYLLWFALLCGIISRLPAQDPPGLLAISHALDSKLAFTTRDARIWEVVSDPAYVSGTAVKVTSPLESMVEGPATIRFWALGGFRYGAIDPVSTQFVARFSTPESDLSHSIWREYRFKVPAGRYRLFWERFVSPRDNEILDAVTVNDALDEVAIQQALDFPAVVIFPKAGEWTVDRTESVLGGASLRQPAYSQENQMEMTVTGPAVLRFALNIGGAGSISGLDVRNGSTVVYQGWGNRLYQWLPMGFFVPAGTHTLNFTNPSNNGVVWMDALAVEPAGAGLAEALDHPGPWTMSGPYPWHNQPAFKHAGSTAAAVSYPSGGSRAGSRLATRVQGPCALAFQSCFEAQSSGGIQLLLDGRLHAATLPVQSSYPVRQVVWQGSRVHIPAGDHVVEWAASPALYSDPALYLLDSVKVDPVPVAGMRAALDSELPWESTGVHLPVIKAAAHAVGGTLLESPANFTGSCQMSFPVQGPARFRFRFSHGPVPAGSSNPFPAVRITLRGSGAPVPISRVSWRNPANAGTTYELGLPAGDLDLVFDLKAQGATKPIPVQFDAAAILPATGVSFAQWAAGLSLTPEERQMDNDLDRRTNFFEYAWGTYPYLRDDRLDILAIKAATAGHGPRLVFKWLPDRIDAAWAIQESRDLRTWQDRWVPQATDAAPVEGGFLTWITEVPQESVPHWFRAIVRPTLP
jgi:hypothetical protein